jgi:TatD DNase family protein
MSIPQPGDFIDIHVHDGIPSEGKFILESLMAHEEKLPEKIPGVAYTYGIHPWFLDENNHINQVIAVEEAVTHPEIIAIGEAGFDKLRGPSPELQLKVFEIQVRLSEKVGKPLIIHCVKAWDELLAVKKNLKPSMPWMIHGFRGNQLLAKQLMSKGIYLSLWFEYVLRPESADLLKSLPHDRFFLETDGANVDIREIYLKAADVIGVTLEEVKERMRDNFFKFFNI